MSYILLNSSEVMTACTDYLQSIEKRIEMRREELIEKFCKPSFFGLIRPSREFAIKTMASDPWHGYNMCLIKFSRNQYEIEELYALARIANRKGVQEVSVSSEHAKILQDWL